MQIKAAVTNTLAAQAVAQPVDLAVEPVQDAPIFPDAQRAKDAAERDLEELKVKYSQLDAIVTTSKALRAEGRAVDEATLAIQEAVKKELAEAIEAQQQVYNVAEKRIADAVGHL